MVHIFHQKFHQLIYPYPLFHQFQSQFFCEKCGAISSKWAGKCEICGSWNTIVEEKRDNFRIKDKSNIKHHLYGFLSVKKNFSVGEWLKKCLTKISEIKKRKKVPIIVGGTGLYFKSLVDGLAKIPNISKRNRDKARKLQEKIGQK